LSVRTFRLHREVDVSGVSGTGMVCEGVQFSDDSVVIRWFGVHASIVIWRSLEDAMAIHGHDGKTQVVWDD
jgi:hypothetical protein